MTGGARLAHRLSVALMGVGVLIATADGFAHSYNGLYDWAITHHLDGWKANTFPLLVDVFIGVGELGLFALALEGHKVTRRGLSWLDMILPFGLAAGGWSVSLAFNVGAAHDTLSDQVTAAVAPIASMLGLLVLLRTVHRLVGTHADTVPEPAAEPAEPTADDHAEPATEPAPADTPTDTPDETVPADHTPQPDLGAAVRSAHAAGMSKAQIQREFGVKRHRLDRLLEPSLNGHSPREDITP